MSLLDTASLVITPNGTKAGTLYSVVPSSGAGDMTVTRATTATRVNSAGLIESVASNVPRLDYSNGTCPSILVEPQRTNLLTYSNDFTNVAWNKTTTTITANYAVSPDGNINASRVQFTAPNSQLFQLVGFQSPSVSSFYVKGIAGQTVAIYNSYNSGGLYELRTLTGDWQRIEVFSTTGYITYSAISNFLGATATDFLIYGAQVEVGSYATSYIPTTSASVTRNADVISKTGISSLIGQTEGTMFVDFYVDNISNQTNNPIFFSFNSSFIQIFDNGRVNYYDGGGNIDINLPSYGLTNGRHKFAIAYNTNDVAFYIDGLLAGTDTNCTPSSKSDLYLTHINSNFYGMFKYNVSALWKTRLTNTQLAQLTTI